jgi:hypothetical protein
MCSKRPVVKLRRRTEGGEAPRWQGATTGNIPTAGPGDEHGTADLTGAITSFLRTPART